MTEREALAEATASLGIAAQAIDGALKMMEDDLTNEAKEALTKLTESLRDRAAKYKDVLSAPTV